MRLPALYAVLALVFAALLNPLPAAAETATGLPTGKRQHKPFTFVKNHEAYRASARRLKNPRQRRAALKLIDALKTAERRSRQHNQTHLDFLKDRARRNGKGGGDVAMEELTISHEGLTLVKSAYGGLRRALGIRTNCVRKCEARKRRCEAACRNPRTCTCVISASDCLLAEIQARRCSSAR